MFAFDPKHKVLRISKIETPAPKQDLTKNQKDSYYKYKTEGIRSDILFLTDLLKDVVSPRITLFNYQVKDVVSSRSSRDTRGRGDMYYPVEVTWALDGTPLDPIVLLRLPYMDDFCVLSTEGGKSKVLVGEMVPLEDISFTTKNNETIESIVLPNRRLNICISPKGAFFYMKQGANGSKKKICADMLLRGVLSHHGIQEQTDDLIVNAIYRRNMLNMAYKTQDVVDDSVANTGFITMIENPAYKVGKLRDTLNERLQIDAALGQTLSRTIELPREGSMLAAGTIVTDAILRKLKWNLINTVHVKAMPKVSGMTLAEDVHITTIPVGTKMNDFLARMFPQYSKHNYLPVTVEDHFVISAGEVLTDDIVATLYYANPQPLKVRRTKTEDVPITMYFEQEIMGNYTFRLRDFVNPATIMKMKSLQGSSFCYTYGLQNPEDIDEVLSTEMPEMLTPWDLLALVSLAARAVAMPETVEQLNKDEDFVKKINLHNESFSRAFRAVMPEYVKEFTRNIQEQFLHNNLHNNPFIDFTRRWTSWLVKKTLLRPVEDLNPIALLSQVNRVVSIVSSNSVPPEMRRLSLNYYGRICPYETPAGKQIGLVNTLAYGCRVVDGVPLTPYYPVIKTETGVAVSMAENSIRWLSPLEEQKYRIGDLLTLKLGEIKNNICPIENKDARVLARIPAVLESDSRTTLENVVVHSLDFVNVYPEQHMSPTSRLIPFAASNDAVRVSYGLNLFRQAVVLQESDSPILRTSMYEELFDYSNTFCVRAERSGKLLEYGPNTVVVLYDGDTKPTTLTTQEISITTNRVTILNYKLPIGSVFDAGDVLVDSTIAKDGVFSPGRDMLVCFVPFEGYNYEDATVVRMAAAKKFTYVNNSPIVQELPDDLGIYAGLGTTNLYKYIPKESLLMELKFQRSNQITYTKDITSGNHHGILYNFEVVNNEKNVKELRAQLLSFNRLISGDKMSGRHGNKGVNSLVIKDSQMLRALNGRIFDMAVNPCGVVSRMNTGQETGAYLGFVGYLLGISIESDSFNGASTEDVKLLFSFVYHCANCERISEVKAMKKFNVLPPELFECAANRWAEIQHWKGCFFENGDAYVYDPMTQELLEYPVTIGVAHYLKEIHDVDHKSNARAGMLEEDYLRLYAQPTKGGMGGGQAHGEMELECIYAHGAMNYLEESMNERSDNVQKRVNMALDLAGVTQEPIYTAEECVSRSVEVARYYLEVLNVGSYSDELPAIDAEAIEQREVVDVKAYIKKARRQFANDIKKSELDKTRNKLDDAF